METTHQLVQSSLLQTHFLGILSGEVERLLVLLRVEAELVVDGVPHLVGGLPAVPGELLWVGH